VAVICRRYLALFSGERTANDCCRCDAFVTTLTGAEGDYDAGEITVLDAALWLQAARIEAIVGETASSTPEAPRWRVWLPSSREYRRSRNLGRCHTRELLGTFTIRKKKSRRSSLPIDVGNPV